MADVPLKQVDHRFYLYPSGKVVGVIDNPDDLEAALIALTDSGMEPDSVETLSGQDGIERLDRSGKRHGFLAQLIRLAQFIGEEDTTIQQHQRELEAGHFLVSVVVDDNQEAKNKVRDMLQAHGARYLQYFGRNVVQDL